MELLSPTDTQTALAGTADWFTDETFSRLSEHPLEAVETEYPHVAGAVESAEETVRPAADHPVFYGCFDWHSAVHSHWSLVRQLRLAEAHPKATEITESIDGRLTAANVEAEVAYFDEHASFEKPYGWGWLLRFAAELHLWDDDRADAWAETLAPLEERIVELVEREFLTQSRPVRVGTHGNSAFALSCVHDYAQVVSNTGLADAAEKTARRFYLDDEDAPVAYEPYGWDFLSPTLAEANLLRRVLAAEAFTDWAARFFPDVEVMANSGFLDPIEVTADSEAGIELHLVGLNVSKAWGLAAVTEAVTASDGPAASETRRREQARLFEQSAARHLTAGVEMAFTDDYAGSHWLSSFVLYLLTRTEAGIAPA
jgi:hypothetical protein